MGFIPIILQKMIKKISKYHNNYIEQIYYYMKYNYDKIVNLVNTGSNYIYKEKYNLWIRYVIESVFNNNMEAEIVVKSMEMLSLDKESSYVLDYIYSTRLPSENIQNIIFSIMKFYINGPDFIRDIYKDYMTNYIEESIRLVEEENKMYYKL